MKIFTEVNSIPLMTYSIHSKGDGRENKIALNKLAGGRI